MTDRRSEAHGWTADTINDASILYHGRKSFQAPGLPSDQYEGLAACIHDAALLAEARRLVAEWDADVDADDTATLDRLLALLPEGDDESDECPICGFVTDRNVLVRTPRAQEYPCEPCLWAHDSQLLKTEGDTDG